MESAFGVEHGVISKLGGPKYRGQALAISERDDKTGTTTTYMPDSMDVRDTGKKSLILRRPKYDFRAGPFASKLEGKKGKSYTGHLQTNVRPNRKSLKAIHAHVTSEKGTRAKEIDGLKVKRVSS